jgi:CRP-like cAMP-binding protein
MTIRPLIRKLEVLGPLADEEKRMLERLHLCPRPVAADRDLVQEGERTSQCLLLVQGFACRYKMSQDGTRQIVSFHIPGDFVDLNSLLLGKMDHSIAAITPVRVAPIPHATILGWTQPYPNLVHLLWRDTLIDAASFREWVINVGRRTAYQRTAHLLCELATRLRAVGLTHGDACDLPISQVKLADALGLSPVHTNRMLQQLRGEGLIELGGGSLIVRDWKELERAGEFDPTYLHQLAAVA